MNFTKKNVMYSVLVKLDNKCSVDTTMVCKKVIGKKNVTEIYPTSKQLKELLVAEQNGWLKVISIKQNGVPVNKDTLINNPTPSTEVVVEEKVKPEVTPTEIVEPVEVAVEEKVEPEVMPTEVVEESVNENDLSEIAEKIALDIISKDTEGRVECPYCNKSYSANTAERYLKEHLVKDHSDVLNK